MSEATFRVDEVLKTEFFKQQEEEAVHDAWFRRQVQIGLASANAGNLIPGTKVEAKFAAKRAATRRRFETSV